jgi:hypothetical protein
MKDQILDFVVENPIVLLVLPIVVGFTVYRRYHRAKRKLGHINDAKSKSLLVIGFIGAAIVIAILLTYL